jgi:hypothetical protein
VSIDYSKAGTEIGELVAKKNAAYGSSFREVPVTF